MKSATAFALVASFVPFALAAPYNMNKHAERDAVVVEYVTDIAVVTAYEQKTVTWNGQSAEETSVAAVSTSAAPEAKKEHHWTWTRPQTTTAAPAPAPETTSAAPAPAPETTTSVYVAPVPTSTSTPVYVAPTPSTTSTPVVVVPTQAPTTTVAPVYSAPAPSDFYTTVHEQYTTLSAQLPTGSGKEGSAGYSNDTGALQALILNSTNYWRAQFQAEPLTWDFNLEAMANDTARLCAWEHTNAGQNLAAGYSGPEEANDAWGNEYHGYNFASPDWSESAGHFTQVVWQDTKTIGCYAYDCGSGHPAQGWYLVCNYLPVGNMLGEFPQNIKPKAS